MSVLKEKFLEYIAVEKRYSAHTIVSYRKDLDDFSCFYVQSEGSEQIEKADKKIIRNFMVHLNSIGLSKRSINRKLSTLRSFYLYLMKIGEVSGTPLEAINSLKFYPEKQIPISVEELHELQTKIAETQHEDLEFLIIETLYQTGMRKAELCGLLLEDVNLSKKEIRVTGKGNKTRIIPISNTLVEYYSHYLKNRETLASIEPQFFLTSKGKKLGEKLVYSIVNKYLSLVTSKKKKSPHILRHSFATHVLDNGAEISKVKKILGHSSLASTQVYTNANIDQLKKVFNNAHPRAQKK